MEEEDFRILHFKDIQIDYLKFHHILHFSIQNHFHQNLIDHLDFNQNLHFEVGNHYKIHFLQNHLIEDCQSLVHQITIDLVNLENRPIDRIIKFFTPNPY